MFLLSPLRKPMEWSEPHDVLLCREVVSREPYSFKKRSSARGRVWSDIADCLNHQTALQFKVTQRSVRERFTLLHNKYKEKKRSAGSSSFSSSQTDALLQEITEKEKVKAKKTHGTHLFYNLQCRRLADVSNPKRFKISKVIHYHNTPNAK